MTHRLAAVARRTACLLAAAALAGGATRAVAAEQVAIPVFIDPHPHLDAPALPRGRVIRVLTTDDYPPFNFTGPDGTLTGFNIDLTWAVCKELEAVCSIETRSFDGLVAALQAGTGDAVIASLAITPAARASVDFSLPTMRMTARFAARADRGPGDVLPETVGSLVVGVQAGTAHEAYLRQFFPRAAVRTFADPESLRTALKEGRIDLSFADGLATALWLNGSSSAACCRFAGGAFTESRYFGEGTGIAVRKGDTVLRQAFDQALQRLSAQGVLADLYLKYVPLGFF